MSAADVERLLAGCDRSTRSGRRDLAVLVLLARLGLRAGEVAAIELGDIDWRAGEIVVRGKARRKDRLPLLVEVGQVLADYLSDGRPSCDCRHLILTLYAPQRPIHPSSITNIVYRACRRAGLPKVGGHRCVTRWRPRCSDKEATCSRSPRSYASPISVPPPDTRRSIGSRCAASPVPGPERWHERRSPITSRTTCVFAEASDTSWPSRRDCCPASSSTSTPSAHRRSPLRLPWPGCNDRMPIRLARSGSGG